MDPFKRFLISLSALILMILIGVGGLMHIEHLSLIEAIYMTVVTMSTTGYGDYVPHSPFGQLFIVGLLIGGVGTIAFASTSLVTIVIEGQLKNFMGRRSMKNEMARLKNHVIVCGAGRVGEHVINRLIHEKTTFLVIERNERIAAQWLERGYLVLIADATLDEVLIEAGILRASGLITALSNDSDNVFVTLSAKGLNPNIRVVARVERSESEVKLLRAGADKVVSPTSLGGSRMANALIKPASVEFVETILSRSHFEIALEELIVGPDSILAGKELSSGIIRSEYGAMVVAIIRDNQVLMNPRGHDRMLAGDLLIILGRPADLVRIEKLSN